MKNKNSGVALRQAILALVSSILTEAILGQLFPGEFAGKYSDGIISISEIADFNSWIRIITVLFVFLIIWLLLLLAIPSIDSIVSRLRYWPKPTYSKRQIASEYYKVKQQLKKIVAECIPCEEYAAIYYVDIASCINTLHRFIYPQSKSSKKIVISAFRKSESVSDIGRYISSYDYFACIRVLKEFLSNASSYYLKNDPTGYFKSDNHELIKRLEELEHVLD